MDERKKPSLFTPELLEELGSVMEQIDAAYAESDSERKIPCPRCGEPLNYVKFVKVNGHRHARCPNKDFGFVE